MQHATQIKGLLRLGEACCESASHTCQHGGLFRLNLKDEAKPL